MKRSRKKESKTLSLDEEMTGPVSFEPNYVETEIPKQLNRRKDKLISVNKSDILVFTINPY